MLLAIYIRLITYDFSQNLYNSPLFRTAMRQKHSKKRFNLQKLSIVSKVTLIVLVFFLTYLMSALIVDYVFPQPAAYAVMREMMGGYTSSTMILIPLIISITLGIIVLLYFFPPSSQRKQEDEYRDEYKIIRKVLSEDEKKVMDEVKKAGEITQDSLRFRLEWSKAKVSTIVTNLDRKGLIQRERVGKTYNLFLQKK